MVLPRRLSQLHVFRQRRFFGALQSSPLRQLGQSIQRRSYASGGSHGSSEQKSELPWAVTSLVTFCVSAYYIGLPPKDPHAHEEHEHDEEHEDGGEEKPEGGEGEEQPESSEGDEQKPGEGEDNSGGEEKQEGNNEGDSSDTEPGSGQVKQGLTRGPPSEAATDAEVTGKGGEGGEAGNVEGIRGKGQTTEGSPSDTRKSYPDSKGYKKKRIESDKAINLGAGVSSSHPDGEQSSQSNLKKYNTQEGKQAGLTNTDTKHSTDIAKDPDKSTKAEGSPETAKTKGSVDPNRPAK